MASTADARAASTDRRGYSSGASPGGPRFRFWGASAQVLMARFEPGSAVGTASVCPGLPAALDAVVVRAMATDPARRYATLRT